MGFEKEAKEILKDLDAETITVSVSVIVSLIKGLIEVLPKDITDDELLALIKSYHAAGDKILEKMDDAINNSEY